VRWMSDDDVIAEGHRLQASGAVLQ
jgi:hypothetical protein